jgi:hypothetical protein
MKMNLKRGHTTWTVFDLPIERIEDAESVVIWIGFSYSSSEEIEDVSVENEVRTNGKEVEEGNTKEKLKVKIVNGWKLSRFNRFKNRVRGLRLRM